MKTNYLLLFILGFSGFSFSQITIDASHMPVVDDTLRVSFGVIDTSIDFESTGPDYVWDFSSIQNRYQKVNTYAPVSASGSITQAIFGTFAASKYKASYFLPNDDLPLNNLPSALPITISDINQFTRNNGDSLTLIGLSMNVNGQQIPAKADTIETKYKFPINYGDAHVGRSYINLNLNPIYDARWRQRRKRTTEVDGWGEITTPYGTFSVLRIHHRIEETDSFKVVIGPFDDWIGISVPVVHEYEWRAQEEKEPILLIKTREANGMEVLTDIEYKNEYILGIEESSLSFNVYPNPATNHLTIESKTMLQKYQIIGTDGRVLKSGILNGTINLLDIEFLKTGSYLLNVFDGNNQVMKSFVKN